MIAFWQRFCWIFLHIIPHDSWSWWAKSPWVKRYFSKQVVGRFVGWRAKMLSNAINVCRYMCVCVYLRHAHNLFSASQSENRRRRIREDSRSTFYFIAQHTCCVSECECGVFLFLGGCCTGIIYCNKSSSLETKMSPSDIKCLSFLFLPLV